MGKNRIVGEEEPVPCRALISFTDRRIIYGSWVTSLWRMEELVERLVRWNIHPEDLITHEFPIEKW
ncbi:MAG: hypothetical protein ACLU6W_10025 [Lachnospiraceae bacterium]